MITLRLPRVLAALLAVFLCTSAIAAHVTLRPAKAGEPVAEVLALRGTVTVFRAGMAVQLVRGADVYRADKIFSYKQAGVKLRFIDGTVVAIGEDSRLIVENYLGASSTAGRVLEMVQGILRATIVKLRGEVGFDVRTRTAVASSRSTDWTVEAKPDTTAVFVINGEVAVTSIATRDDVVLGPGEGTDVAAGQSPKPPVQWGQARIDDFLARTAIE